MTVGCDGQLEDSFRCCFETKGRHGGQNRRYSGVRRYGEGMI